MWGRRTAQVRTCRSRVFPVLSQFASHHSHPTLRLTVPATRHPSPQCGARCCHSETLDERYICCMSRTVRSPLLTAWRLLSSRSPLLQLKTNAVAMSAPAATSAQPTPASSMSSPSASASSTVNPPHVPECPRFKTIAVGDRLYRQQIIPSPAGLSSSFHSSPTASSPTTPAARPPGTSSAASASHPLPLDESLLPLVNEVRDDAGALLYRLTVDIQYACMLSSMSRMQRRAVEDIEQQHLTNILLPTKTPHSHTIGNSAHQHICCTKSL